MLFNSLDFAIFLPIVFLLYWFVAQHKLKVQNFLIILASYFFYGWWDWRFLFLILLSTIVDYSIGLALKKENRTSKRKIYLWISILVNLGLLGFFKYYNFFRRKLEPTKDFIAFGAFVSFFPQLVAGPIERATNLLPQFYVKRKFDYSKAKDGMRQILWGLFKKVVIADNCAEYANLIFNNSDDYSGSTLLLGAFFFTFQIYGDFSGYSDIAIGTSRLFGFNLMQNFAFPYFSRDIAEFWRRWHISLSTWFRDYLYIPLGGSRGGLKMKIRNTFVIFLVSGFWHGANWTFVVWGALNALYFLPLLIAGKNRQNLGLVAEGRLLPNIKEFIQICTTFLLTMLAWIFFRASSVGHALSYLKGIFSKFRRCFQRSYLFLF